MHHPGVVSLQTVHSDGERRADDHAHPDVRRVRHDPRRETRCGLGARGRGRVPWRRRLVPPARATRARPRRRRPGPPRRARRGDGVARPDPRALRSRRPGRPVASPCRTTTRPTSAPCARRPPPAPAGPARRARAGDRTPGRRVAVAVGPRRARDGGSARRLRRAGLGGTRVRRRRQLAVPRGRLVRALRRRAAPRASGARSDGEPAAGRRCPEPESRSTTGEAARTNWRRATATSTTEAGRCPSRTTGSCRR